LEVVGIWALQILESLNASEFIKSFVADAVIVELGFVITFVPCFCALYSHFFLESGYISVQRFDG
jgi:hypothetical protein